MGVDGMLIKSVVVITSLYMQVSCCAPLTTAVLLSVISQQKMPVIQRMIKSSGMTVSDSHVMLAKTENTGREAVLAF